MNILITGATGFLGEHVVPMVLQKYKKVTCFVRKDSNTSTISYPGVSLYYGDAKEKNSLQAALRNIDILINLIPFASGCIPDIVDACVKTNVKRAIFIGNTQIFNYQPKNIKQTLIKAEESIISSPLIYTILRPTMIYGTPKDRNMIKLIRFLDKSLIVPIPGNGQAKLRPVFVKDVAKAIISVINCESTYKKVYNISGRDALTFNQIVDLIGQNLGVNRLKIHVPLSIIYRLMCYLSPLFKRIPLKREQIQRFNEDRDFDHKEATKDFGYFPIFLKHGIAQEIRMYRELEKDKK